MLIIARSIDENYSAMYNNFVMVDSWNAMFTRGVIVLPFLLIFGTGVYGFGFFFLTRDPAAFGYDSAAPPPAEALPLES